MLMAPCEEIPMLSKKSPRVSKLKGLCTREFAVSPWPTPTMATAYSMCHPILCFCVNTLLTGPDYLQYIQEPYVEEERVDHYESKWGEQLRAELGLDWTPGIQRLINSLAILTLSYTVRMIHRTTDDPESVMSVSSQRPRLIKRMFTTQTNNKPHSYLGCCDRQ